MNKDQLRGRGRRVVGKAKEMAGKVAGDERAESEGRVDQAHGKAQEAWGDTKEGVKALAREIREG